MREAESNYIATRVPTLQFKFNQLRTLARVMAEDSPYSSPPPTSLANAPLGFECDLLSEPSSGHIFSRWLPIHQVAVIDSQSNGKSSVLEALIDCVFLPRDNEICTRLPLVLQLVQTKVTNNDDDEYDKFLHLLSRKFHDFSEIRREIQVHHFILFSLFK